MTEDARAYRGNVVRDFVIDRLALGMGFDTIVAEFDGLYGTRNGIREDEVAAIATANESQIAEREAVFREKFKSADLFESLSRLRAELEGVKTDMLEQERMKAYVGVVQQLIRTLELTEKAARNFSERKTVNLQVVQQNNFVALEVLERDGLLSIKDKARLKKVLGVGE